LINYQVVRGDFVTLGAYGIKAVYATCPAGTMPTGGGYQVQGSAGDVNVMYMDPQGQSYRVIAYNDSANATNATSAQAICAA
jgi:hypothetical protein